MGITFEGLTKKKHKVKQELEDGVRDAIRMTLVPVARYAADITPVLLGRLIHNYGFTMSESQADFGFIESANGSRGLHTTSMVARVESFKSALTSPYVKINFVNSHEGGEPYRALDAGILTRRSAGGQTGKINEFARQRLDSELEEL